MIIVLATLALVSVLVAQVVVDARMLPAASVRHSLLLGGGIAAAGAVPWLVLAPLLAGPSVGALLTPVAVLGSIAAWLATVVVRAVGMDAARTIAFAALWSAAVFVPAALLAFTSVLPLGVGGLSPLDHGGALAANVAPGAAALAVVRVTRASGRRLADVPLRWSVLAVAGVVAGWSGWLVWAELAVDAVTPVILLSALFGALGGTVGWLVVQRVRHHTTTVDGVGAGLVCGLAAVTAGAPLLGALPGFVLGVLAGAVGALVGIGTARRTRRPQWSLVGMQLVGGVAGLLAVGLVGSGLGMFLTGQPVWLATQLLAAVTVAVWSAVVSIGLWVVLGGLRVSRAPAAQAAAPRG